MIGVIGRRDIEKHPFGKQTYFFEDMLLTLNNSEANKFLFFTPGEFDQNNFIIKEAFQFDIVLKEWREVTDVKVPAVIYDRYWTKSGEEKLQFSKFKAFAIGSNIVFMNPPGLTSFVRNKFEVYKFLKLNKIKTPESILLKKYKFNLLSNLLKEQEEGEYYLKPATGSRGNGIMVISLRSASDISIRIDDEYYDKIEDAENIIVESLSKTNYILQPKVSSLKLMSDIYDIRVLVNNVDDEYKITGLGVRYNDDEYRSNLNQGGCASSYERFFDSLNQTEKGELLEEVKHICISVSNKIHNKYGPFIELGFDILIDDMMNCLILEINSKPSRWMFVLVSESDEETEQVRRRSKMTRDLSVHLPAKSLLKIANEPV